MASEARWSVVLNSGCHEGVEMRRVWQKLEREERESADWLDKDMDPVFAGNLEGLGGGSVTGATRGEIVSARERTRALLLAKALADHRPKKDRPAWAWRQRDKISSSWLLARPGADSTLSNREFSEASAASLCLPSPACVGRVGETVKGQVKVDMYGDKIQATNLSGDHWRLRHDMVKNVIGRLCTWAGVPCELEVFNLFSGLIPQAGLARIEKERQRQAMVPDFKITLNSGGQSAPVLHELKVISSSRSRYSPTHKDRGVDKRASQLNKEYQDKAKNADRLHGGLQPGVVGRVEAKLLTFPPVRGIVFGNWGEVSEDTHRLVDALATSRARVAEPQSGRRGRNLTEEGVKSLAVSFIRRKLGVAAVRAQCLTLLGRLETMGPAAVLAAGRRRRALDQERAWARERRTDAFAAKQGHNLLRRGFAKLD